MKRLGTLGIAAVLTLFTAQASAQDAAALKRSDEHFKEGARLYHAGDYDQSILELKSGYALAPHPIFLVNIALAYAKVGNWAEAADYGAQAALVPGLEPEPAAQTIARSAAWRVRLASGGVAQAEPVIVVEPNPPEVAVRPKPGVVGWVGVGTAAIGLLGVGGAVVIGATLQDERRAYEVAGAAGDAEEYDRLRDRIEGGQTLGRILLFSGIGLVALGGGLFAVDLLRAEQVAVGPGTVSVRWAWR